MMRMLISVLFAVVTGAGAVTASVPPLADGYYRSVNSRPSYEAFIKSESIDGVMTTYAALYQEGSSKKNSKDFEYGALFRLEALEDGTLVWTLIYQGQNNLLTMLIDTPLYQSRMAGTNLSLWATPDGTRLRCPSTIDLAFVPGGQWGTTSGQVRLADRYRREAYFNPTSLQLSSSLSSLWSQVEDKTPGPVTSYFLTPSLVVAQVLRARGYDSESASGLSYSREIRGVTISTFQKNQWTVRIIDQPVGEKACWYRGATLK